MGNLNALNSAQREAAEHIEGPLLILAGAGSGKTRVLIHRIAEMIDNYRINPWNILAITFTNKAAGEMRERVDKLIGQGADSIWVATFHATCARILRRHIDLIGYDTDFSIYDTDDQKTVMKDVLKRLNIDSKILKERMVLNAISRAKDELIGVEEFTINSKGDYRAECIARAYDEYQTTLKKNNCLDFDDIIVLTIKLFKEHPQVLDNYQERFKYIMVDEYQDTNTAQFELIRLLADKYRNLCVVGDDDQSIYKFRGANVSNILDFEKVYPEAKVVKLEQNYRSSQNILDAANSVIGNNEARKDKSLWTDSDKGSLIHLRQLDNAYEEAEFVAGDIRSAVNRGAGRLNECAVLYRTNAQSRIMEEAFVREGIAYNIVGGVNFYSRKEIKDILAYLKTINNGVDDVAVKRIINVPRRGIGQTTINKVSDYAANEGISFFDALCDAERIPGLGKASAKIAGFTNMILVMRSRLEVLGIEGLLKDVIDQTGYVKELEESGEEDATDRIENIDELISKAASYEEAEEEPTLSGFLEDVALVSDIDMTDSEAERVLLMTLHAAKGLEFDRVYITGMEEGLFPSSMTLFDEDPTAIEEERRLAYVGITRARHELFLTYAKMRMLRGETQFNAVSRFVKEIPEGLMDNRLPKPRFFGDSFDVPAPAAVKKQVVSIREIQEQEKARQREAIIRKEGQPNIKLDYVVGDRVRHIKYGEGIVTAIEQAPKDKKVTVLFDQVGQKIMYASFARLVKL